MPRVKLLSKNVAELIAAGEVVERPASVVKELMENCLDAGATSIEVEIAGGGLRSIRVSDNGCGIEREDVRTAFLRHATSKIWSESDLGCISTLGFRGEALAAISSVSRVRMLTKRPEDPFGTEIVLEGGEERLFEEAGCPDGTTITVSDLFYNTPARMKFLKKDVAEGNSVRQTVERLAMSRPEVAVRFIRDGKTAFSTPGDGKLYSAIFASLPEEVADGLIAVCSPGSRCSVAGFVSSPGSTRKSRSWQYIYVNGRFVKSRSVAAAVEEAYRNLAMHGRYPSFVLDINVPPDSVDVNVHPAKTEVRFADERLICGAVYRAVKTSVEDASRSVETAGILRPSHDEPKPSERIAAADDATPPVQRTVDSAALEFASYVPAKCAQQLTFKDTSAPEEFLLESPSAFERQRPAAPPVISHPHPQERKLPQCPSIDIEVDAPSNKRPAFRLIGEAFSTYIVAEREDKVVFIDKHAAHERLLFERLNSEDLTRDRQILLSPVVVTVSAEEKLLLMQAREDIEAIGFLIDDFGDNSVAVREVPVFQPLQAVEDAVAEMARQLAFSAPKLHTRDTEWLLHSASCRAAIKAGHRTSDAELLELAGKILDGDVPKFCPHGRPVFFAISKKELEKSFGRVQ